MNDTRSVIRHPFVLCYHWQICEMLDLPKIGTMIRCVGPRFEAGAVTFNGHSRIELPRRTDDGRVLPDAIDLYQLKRVGEEWVYERIDPRGMRMTCDHCTKPISGGAYSNVYLRRADGTVLDPRVLHAECIAAFKAVNRADIDSIEDIENSDDYRSRELRA